MSTLQRAFIAGHGKLPSGSAAKAAYDTLALTVEIEQTYGVILRVECTLATELGRDFLSDLLRGYSLKDGVDAMVDEVKATYYGAAKGALLAALKDLELEYNRMSEV